MRVSVSVPMAGTNATTGLVKSLAATSNDPCGTVASETLVSCALVVSGRRVQLPDATPAAKSGAVLVRYRTRYATMLAE